MVESPPASLRERVKTALHKGELPGSLGACYISECRVIMSHTLSGPSLEMATRFCEKLFENLALQPKEKIHLTVPEDSVRSADPASTTL